MEYKGIKIERNGNPHFSASRFVDRSRDTQYYDLMLSISGARPEHFEVEKDRDGNVVMNWRNEPRMKYIGGKESTAFNAISRVVSVVARNYQICNGGIGQYYCNGYDLPSAPYCPYDYKIVCRNSQLSFIKGELDDFAHTVLTGDELKAWENYVKINSMPSKGWEANVAISEAFPELNLNRYGDENWNNTYYRFNKAFELVVELYSQYLFKKFTADDPWMAFQAYMQNDLASIRREKYYNYHGNPDFDYISVAERFGEMFA